MGVWKCGEAGIRPYCFTQPRGLIAFATYLFGRTRDTSLWILALVCCYLPSFGIGCSTKSVHFAINPDRFFWKPCRLSKSSSRGIHRLIPQSLILAVYFQDCCLMSTRASFCQTSRLTTIPADRQQQQWQVLINRFCCVLSAHLSAGTSNSKWLGLHSPVFFRGPLVPHLITPIRKGFASGSIRSRFASYRC